MVRFKFIYMTTRDFSPVAAEVDERRDTLRDLRAVVVEVVEVVVEVVEREVEAVEREVEAVAVAALFECRS